MNLSVFAEETASESPAPGGGSISAYVGALGASLGSMVANLSANKRGWDDKWEEYSKWAVKGQKYRESLTKLVDEDTKAFNKIMDAFGLPKNTQEEKEIRSEAIQNATKGAIETPFKVMKEAFNSMSVMKKMAEIGLPASISDAGVGALCARTAVLGAFLNVKINTSGLKDEKYKLEILNKCTKIQKDTIKLEKEILDLVEAKL